MKAMEAINRMVDITSALADRQNIGMKVGVSREKKMRKRREAILHEFNKMGITSIDFLDEEIHYMSKPSDCEMRNSFLLSHTIRHICDAYACIGGDTLQFMALKPEARIDAVQIGSSDSDTSLDERFNRLENNVAHFQQASGRNLCFTHKMSIGDFILTSFFNTVDFLYCDPPWTTEDGEYYDCKTIIGNLKRDIELINHKPHYICFKVPYAWLGAPPPYRPGQFQNILEIFPNYMLLRSAAFYFGAYWMHILKLEC